MNKQLLATIVIVAIVVLGAVYVGTLFNKPVPESPVGSIAGPDFPGPYFSINGLQTWISAGDWKNATTTFVSVINPTGSTSTVDFIQLTMTGVATSSIQILCGVDTNAYGEPAINLMRTAGGLAIATSTNFQIMTNDATSTLGYLGTPSTSNNRVLVGPKEYINCLAEDPNGKWQLGSSADQKKYGVTTPDGIAGASNTFAGTFKIRWLRGN